MIDAVEQRKAATKRIRKRFSQVKSDLEDKYVRHTDIGTLLELLIDQEVRIETLEAAVGNAGNAPALSRVSGGGGT